SSGTPAERSHSAAMIMLCAWMGICMPYTRVPGAMVINARSQAFDDGDVGLTAALTHGLEPVAATRALELVEQGGHEARSGGTQRMAERDRAAVHVHLRQVEAALSLPCEDHRRERFVD